jgi:hypothetical protein
MSIHNIPSRFLNTTLEIYGEQTQLNDVGDTQTVLINEYSSVKANVQSSKDETEFAYQGSVHVRDHVAYINRMEDTTFRDIRIGFVVADNETNIRYLVLGVEEWQAANVNITDSHHIKLILKSLSGVLPIEPVGSMVTAKAKIINAD